MSRVLVVEDDVGQPDVFGRDVQCLDTSVLLGVPFELVVGPFLVHDTDTDGTNDDQSDGSGSKSQAETTAHPAEARAKEGSRTSQ